MLSLQHGFQASLESIKVSPADEAPKPFVTSTFSTKACNPHRTPAFSQENSGPTQKRNRSQHHKTTQKTSIKGSLQKSSCFLSSERRMPPLFQSFEALRSVHCTSVHVRTSPITKALWWASLKNYIVTKPHYQNSTSSSTFQAFMHDLVYLLVCILVLWRVHSPDVVRLAVPPCRGGRNQSNPRTFAKPNVQACHECDELHLGPQSILPKKKMHHNYNPLWIHGW